MSQVFPTNEVLNKGQQNNPNSKKISCVYSKSEYFNGPLPHPEILKKYEETLPGAANRIIRMAERQSQHRQQLEARVINSNISHEKIGMYLAFLITTSLATGGFYLILLNKNIIGYTTFIGTFVFHIYNYLSQRKKESIKPPKKSVNKDKK